MSMRGRPAVVIERLRLQGFGRHRDLELHFPAALAVWVAPNEAGKSTAILGLVATLCGVPHLQESSGFSWGRFRSFHGGPHRGVVELRRAEERYLVERTFDQHRVRVTHHTPTGWERVFEGDHNPNARREVSGYSQWLRATLGIEDANLLLATFVVAQGDLGGAPHQLSEQVQALLAGAGGNTANDALARLEALLRGVTRKLRGLAPLFVRDGRNEQPLDLAQARLETLLIHYREGAELADSLATLQRAAELASARARTALAEADRLRAVAAARQTWVERREATLRALRRAHELNRAAATARELEAALAQGWAELELVHPELTDAEIDTFDERIASWARAHEAHAAQQARSARAREALHDAETLALSEQQASERLPDTPPAEPGEALRQQRAAEAAARRWRHARDRLDQLRAQLHDADATLTRLAPLLALAPEQRAALRGHRQEAARLSARWEAARETHAAWLRALAEANDRFGAVADLSEETAAALRAFKHAVDTPDPAEPWRWLGALGVSGLGVATGVVLSLASWPLVAAVAAGAGLLWLLLWPRQPRLKRLRRSLRAQAARVPALHGGDAEVLEFAERYAAYLGYREEIEGYATGEREAAERLAATSAQNEAFNARWGALQRALSEGTDADGVDLEAAADALQGALAQRAEAREQAQAVAQAAGVGNPETLIPEAPAQHSGPDGARLLAWGMARGGVSEEARVTELDAFIADCDASRWSQWASHAAAEDAAERRRAREAELLARQQRQAAILTEALERELTHEAGLRAAEQAAQDAALTGLPVGTSWPSAAALRLAWRQRTALLAAGQARAQQLETHLRAVGAAQVEELLASAGNAHYEARRQHGLWEALVLEHPDLPPADLEVGGSFDTQQVSFVAAGEAAARAQTAAEAAREAALAAAEALARAQGTDPIDVAAVELEIEELRAEVATGCFERDALALALKTLQRASQTTLEGQARQLEVTAAAHLEELSGVRGRRLRFDADMRASAVEADGQTLSMPQLSQGARDQLALALRFAIKDLISDQVALPMILDDPFLNWDAARAAAAAAALQRAAARGEQLWLVSHRPELARWGEPLTIREASG